jgi:integrase
MRTPLNLADSINPLSVKPLAVLRFPKADAKNTLKDNIATRLVIAVGGTLTPTSDDPPITAAEEAARDKRSAEMLRVDLAKAKILYETEEGVVDFHALRVTYITNLARSGVHPKVAQILARHSTMELTMRVYTKLNPTDVSGAVNAIFEGTNRAQQFGSKRNNGDQGRQRKLKPYKQV